MISQNDFQRRWVAIQQPVLNAVRRVGESGRYILGEQVQRFEAALAKEWGIEHAVGVANGMDAIEIGLRWLSIRTVIKLNIETPRHCDNKLLTTLERMASSSSTSRNIIKVENPLDLERHMPTTFNGREIAFWICYFRQVDQFTILESHLCDSDIANATSRGRRLIHEEGSVDCEYG